MTILNIINNSVKYPFKPLIQLTRSITTLDPSKLTIANRPIVGDALDTPVYEGEVMSDDLHVPTYDEMMDELTGLEALPVAELSIEEYELPVEGRKEDEEDELVKANDEEKEESPVKRAIRERKAKRKLEQKPKRLAKVEAERKKDKALLRKQQMRALLEVPMAKLRPICTIDIETALMNDHTLTVAVTGRWHKFNVERHLIDFMSPDIGIKEAESMMWASFFDATLPYTSTGTSVFLHNFGGFDALYLIPQLLAYLNGKDKETLEIRPLMDSQGKYISVGVKFKIGETGEGSKKTDIFTSFTFKDSYRVFPVSLAKLCEIMKVDGKLGEWNPSWDFDFVTNHEVLTNPQKIQEYDLFRKYALRDSTALWEALMEAQDYYQKTYEVDLSTAFSLSSLALKVYRTRFMPKELAYDEVRQKLVEVTKPLTTLSKFQDDLIRPSYAGGSASAFKPVGSDLHYYDINSLYPWAMLQTLPDQLLKTWTKMRPSDLDTFFGFVEVVVTTPSNMEVPLLHYRDENGQLVYPTGTWTGWYFSEEIKALMVHGYKFIPLQGHEFTKHEESPFKEYITHFYDLKSSTIDPTVRFMSKMMLNQLYGFFGREPLIGPCMIVDNVQLNCLITANVVETYHNPYTDRNVVSIVVVKRSEKFEHLDLTTREILGPMNLSATSVNSNVALAAAITAHARIRMIDFKTIPGNPPYYTDTDSVWLQYPLDPIHISKEIGFMKDELKGATATQFIALNTKQYAYTVTLEGKYSETAVYAGLKRNDLKFSDFEKLLEGGIVLAPPQKRSNISYIHNEVKIGYVDNIKMIHTPNNPIVDGIYKPYHVYTKPSVLINMFWHKVMNRKRKT